MKKMVGAAWGLLITLILICPFSGLAQTATPGQVGAINQKSADPQTMMERMREKGMAEGMAGKPMMAPCGKTCPNCPHGSMSVGSMGMHGTMMDKMERWFFLDRTEELGLSADQVARLTGLRNACRQDNIRAAAELKIARLELNDLLAGDWNHAEAEKLVRKIHSIEADMELRHLKSRKDAEQVLSPEQLQKARTASASGPLEELFQ